jgi:ribose transport system substrate-binding protein
VTATAALGAGCGSSDSTSTTGTSASGDGSTYDAQLASLYKGEGYSEPTGDAPKPVPGKNVWFVSVGLGTGTTAASADAAKAAGKQLGWKVTVSDGQFDSSKMLTGIQQAVAAQADGIILWAIDCKGVRNGLEEAKQANIPVVAIESVDCDPPLFTHTVAYGGNTEYLEYITEWGAAMARYVIAREQGKAKTILVEQTDLSSTLAVAEGWREEFAKCEGCEIVDTVKFVGADFGPKLQTKIEQAVSQNPDANSIIPAYDAVMTSGGAAAIRSAGRQGDMFVMGGEGTKEGIEQIRAGNGMEACIGINPETEAYGGIDALVRIFAGQSAAGTNTGQGYQACDKDNNMPPEGEAYQPPVDFVTAYETSWGVGGN